MNRNKKIVQKTELPKEVPYRVPDGYFDEFAGRLNARIRSEKNNRSYLTLPAALRPYAAAAIIIIAAVITGSLIFRNPGRPDNAAPLQKEISQLVEDDIYSYDESMIMEAIGTGDNRNDPGSEEVIDYLLNEDITETDLINAL